MVKGFEIVGKDYKIKRWISCGLRERVCGVDKEERIKDFDWT